MDSRKVIASAELISACSDCSNLNVAEEASFIISVLFDIDRGPTKEKLRLPVH
jgi:hypothetical protein